MAVNAISYAGRLVCAVTCDDHLAAHAESFAAAMRRELDAIARPAYPPD